MRTSWHPGTAQASVVVLAGLTAMPITVLPARAAATAPATAPATAGASAGATVPATAAATARASAGAPRAAVPAQPAVPALTIGVSDSRTAVKAGDQLTYVVSIRDGGTRSAPHLKITQTLSPGLKFLSATPHGTAAGGQVAWHTGIPAGGTETFRVLAKVTRPPAQVLRLAAVACAAADGSSTPIVCAAHLDRLPTATASAAAPRAARPAGLAVLAYTAAALLALAAAAATIITVRRRLRLQRRPA